MNILNLGRPQSFVFACVFTWRAVLIPATSPNPYLYHAAIGFAAHVLSLIMLAIAITAVHGPLAIESRMCVLGRLLGPSSASDSSILI